VRAWVIKGRKKSTPLLLKKSRGEGGGEGDAKKNRSPRRRETSPAHDHVLHKNPWRELPVHRGKNGESVHCVAFTHYAKITPKEKRPPRSQ